ncbi:MAG TPA: Mur ligase family protein, partial [Chroococcales cyanobacterium]
MAASLRLWSAYLLVKAVKAMTSLIGREGTSLPGALALRVMPRALKGVRSRLATVVMVTGTNGKTTTTRILADIARESGFRVITNSLGANLKQGITTALLDSLPEMNKKNNKEAIAIIEVDEATLPKVIEDLQPQSVIVTNFFRDQMDRYAELDHVVATVKRALDSVSTKRVLNADDPLTRSLGEKDSEFFGLSPECGEKNENEKSENAENVLDGQTCKICGERLNYSVRFYGQLGDYKCSCGFSRPSPKVEGKNLILSSEGYGFEALGIEAKIGSPGRYNVYNALAAMAGATAMGWP